jgi:NhaA family Na+:H+ antiporter
MVSLKISVLPEGVGWRQIVGAGFLAGIGFTMSIFIAGLAFEDEALVQVAKIGIFTASFISAIIGLLVLSMAKAGK